MKVEHLKSLTEKYSLVYYFNSNGAGDSYLALGDESAKQCKSSVLEELKTWLNDNSLDWVFGYFGYDLKNQVEDLHSSNPDKVEFPESFFFVPQVLVKIESNGDVSNEIGDFSWPLKSELTVFDSEIDLKWRVSKNDYLQNVSNLLEHIQKGDVYEINYCHEFYAKKVQIDPTRLYQEVNELTKAPFNTFVKNEHLYAICASPERFIKRTQNRIISQPIKGTIKRDLDPIQDKILIERLENDEKERSENIMIVDIVRNDLSKVALPNSVKVDELCKIYSFETVHQMISTVSATVAQGQNNFDIIMSCFPMGSMTGAPKIKAMELIEKYESTKRGLYSGAIGYFKPNGDFDFNVVIRTLLYNEKNKNLSGMVGGAITSKSDPQQEFEETKLKAEALIKAVKNASSS
ncbi:MAG: para-aminobenzoate synthetase component 1 [Parvicellaceae bacterium]|jgi:para-aminobenzoate synthetase component 1